MMKKRLFFSLVCALILMLFSTNIIAQTPRVINYQASLMDANGKHLPLDQPISIIFAIYKDESGGPPLWTETQVVTPVAGYFSCLLGSQIPILLDFKEEYWLEVNLGNSNSYPRTRLSTVPYSFNSLKSNLADTASIAYSVVNESITQSKLAPGVKALPFGIAGGHLTGTYPNPKLNFDSLNSLVRQNFIFRGETAFGDLDSLYPSPIIKTNAVTTEKLGDNAVTIQKLANFAVNTTKIDPLDPNTGFNALDGQTIMMDPVRHYVLWGYPTPGGTAGGDLSGNYPNPAVSGFRGFPISVSNPLPNQIYSYNSGSWTPAFISPPNLSTSNTVGSIEDGYVLSWAWNGGTNPKMQWVATNSTVSTQSPLIGNGTPGSPVSLNVSSGFAPDYSVLYMTPGRVWAASLVGTNNISDGSVTNAKISNSATFTDIQDGSGISQFYISNSDKSLRFQSGGSTTVSFNPATHTVDINSSGGDNWGTQAAITNASLQGDGTTLNPLAINLTNSNNWSASQTFSTIEASNGNFSASLQLAGNGVLTTATSFAGGDIAPGSFYNTLNINNGAITLPKLADPGTVNNGIISYWNGAAWTYSANVLPAVGQVLKLNPSGTVTWANDNGTLPETYSGSSGTFSVLDVTSNDAGYAISGRNTGSGGGIYADALNNSALVVQSGLNPVATGAYVATFTNNNSVPANRSRVMLLSGQNSNHIGEDATHTLTKDALLVVDNYNGGAGGMAVLTYGDIYANGTIGAPSASFTNNGTTPLVIENQANAYALDIKHGSIYSNQSMNGNLLELRNSGNGTLFYGVSNGSADGINLGMGPASTGNGMIINMANPSSSYTGLFVDHNGTGNAGFFQLSDAAVSNTNAAALAAVSWSAGTSPVISTMNAHGAALYGTNVSGDGNATGLVVEIGRTILSYADATNPGGGFPWDLSAMGYATVINIPNGASDGTMVLPLNAENGQILYVNNNSGIDLTAGSGTITNGRTAVYVYSNGAWQVNIDDNWGNQTALTNTTLVGNGTASNRLGIDLSHANTWTGTQIFSVANHLVTGTLSPSGSGTITANALSIPDGGGAAKLSAGVSVSAVIPGNVSVYEYASNTTDTATLPAGAEGQMLYVFNGGTGILTVAGVSVNSGKGGTFGYVNGNWRCFGLAP